MDKPHVETIFRIHDDCGYVEVAEDPDGVGLVTIKWYEKYDKQITHTITIPAGCEYEVANAIKMLADKLKDQK